MAMASYLANHPKVQKVYYPGLPITRSTSWRSGR
jgi:cystathionine beta-lyase/cystathionine gamma-synthase